MTDDQSGAYDPAADPVHGSGWNSAARWGGWTWRPPRDGEWYRSCSFCGCIHPDDLSPLLVEQGPCAVCGETGWEAHFRAQQPGWYKQAKARGELAGFPADEIARVEALPAEHPYDPGGAYASWADWKYGWPHKFYVENLLSREPDRLHVVGARHRRPDDGQSDDENGMRWVSPHQIPEGTVTEGWRDLDGRWDQVALATRPTLHAKFYTRHLADTRISPAARESIERGCGLRFTFDGDRVSWQRYAAPV